MCLSGSQAREIGDFESGLSGDNFIRIDADFGEFFMVEISEPTHLGPVTSTADKKSGREEQPNSGNFSGAKQKPRSAGEISDVANVMGIPPEELTPAVSAALTSVFHDFDCQREELDHLRAHTAFLEAQVDEHSYLPILNPRALRRELGLVLQRAEQSATPSCFVCLSVRELDGLRRRHGRTSGEAALHHLVTVVLEQIRASDTLGSLGGYDLGVILTVTEEKAAREKVQDILEALADKPFQWRGRLWPVKVEWALAPCPVGGDVLEVIGAVDQALSDFF